MPNSVKGIRTIDITRMLILFMYVYNHRNILEILLNNAEHYF